jgi:hypothetical protein
MHPAQRLAGRARLLRRRMRQRYAFQKLDQAGRAARDRLDLDAFAILQRARHGQSAIRQMIEQREEEGQVARIHALLVQCQDEAPTLGLDQIIAVLDALGDALERSQRAHAIAHQQRGHLLGRHMGVDRHLLPPLMPPVRRRALAAA